MVGPLLEVKMSKKCTPLWREAHFEVKMYKTLRGSDHFWKLRCRKSASRCGAKHISKSKVLKTGGLGPLLEVEMSKKCTPLWREARFEVKMYKTLHVRATFGGSDVASPLRFTTLRYITPHSTILHYITLHYTPQHYNYNYTTRLHSTTLHYIKFHYTTLLHYTTLRSTTLHYIKLDYTPLHYITLHYAPQHYNYNYTTTFHYTPLH